MKLYVDRHLIKESTHYITYKWFKCPFCYTVIDLGVNMEG